MLFNLLRPASKQVRIPDKASIIHVNGLYIVKANNSNRLWHLPKDIQVKCACSLEKKTAVKPVLSGHLK